MSTPRSLTYEYVSSCSPPRTYRVLDLEDGYRYLGTVKRDKDGTFCAEVTGRPTRGEFFVSHGHTTRAAAGLALANRAADDWSNSRKAARAAARR